MGERTTRGRTMHPNEAMLGKPGDQEQFEAAWGPA
jgi:hypothetical protein